MASPKRSLDAQARELRSRLAANLRAYRARIELTQERLAERVGFSLQYVQRIEREIVNVPLDTIARFGVAFEIDPTKLLARRPEPSRRSRARR